MGVRGGVALFIHNEQGISLYKGTPGCPPAPLVMVTEFDVVDCFANELLQPSGTALPLTTTVYDPGTRPTARKAWATVEGGSIRVYFDGTVPTSSAGILYSNGDRFPINGRSNLKNFRVIDATGSPKVWLQYGS